MATQTINIETQVPTATTAEARVWRLNISSLVFTLRQIYAFPAFNASGFKAQVNKFDGTNWIGGTQRTTLSTIKADLLAVTDTDRAKGVEVAIEVLPIDPDKPATLNVTANVLTKELAPTVFAPVVTNETTPTDGALFSTNTSPIRSMKVPTGPNAIAQATVMFWGFFTDRPTSFLVDFRPSMDGWAWHEFNNNATLSINNGQYTMANFPMNEWVWFTIQADQPIPANSTITGMSNAAGTEAALHGKIAKWRLVNRHLTAAERAKNGTAVPAANIVRSYVLAQPTAGATSTPDSSGNNVAATLINF